MIRVYLVSLIGFRKPSNIFCGLSGNFPNISESQFDQECLLHIFLYPVSIFRLSSQVKVSMVNLGPETMEVGLKQLSGDLTERKDQQGEVKMDFCDKGLIRTYLVVRQDEESVSLLLDFRFFKTELKSRTADFRLEPVLYRKDSYKKTQRV